MTIDFRSDTVTKPTPAMMHAMMNAAVGDDVFGEDPSINALEEMAARLFNMEAALFCPSGTMSNQTAIRCHTQPGDEVICSSNAHVYIYEGGGIAANSGSQVRAIQGNYGQITGQQVLAAINPDDVHKARTRLVCLENTANRGGGSCYDIEEIRKIRKICNENSLQMHLDGARLFNALVAKKETARQYGEIFDSISVCLSKGLGCPIGSVLLGSKSFMTKARRVRKVFGGSMRQAGFMAGAGIYALQNNIERLSQDHLHAKLIGEALMKKDFAKNIMPVETNIVIVTTKENCPAKQIAERLCQKGVQVIDIGPNELRFVTHLDISEVMVEKTIQIIKEL
jgi:threonine aldolase